MKKLIFYLFLFTTSGIFSQKEDEHYLIVNPNGHKGIIRKLLLTSDKKKMITGGFDKTIKVWDVESGELEREILGQIGTGSNGMIYDMDLSPDNKLLACGGWLGSDGEKENLGTIRVFDFQSGKLLYILPGHVNVINALKFADNGKKLISGDAENDLWLWDLEKKSVIRKYKHHIGKEGEKHIDDEVNEIALYGNNFITADQNGIIKLWDLNKDDTLKADFYFRTIQADGVAISPDGKYMAACADTFMTIYDKNMVPIADITSHEEPVFLAFSPDGKKLLTGCSVDGAVHKLYVYALEDTAWVEHSSFNDFDALIMTGAFIDNETYAVAGGTKDEVMIVKIGKKGSENKLQKKMKGFGFGFRAVALNDNIVSYAEEWTSNFGLSAFNRQFDLITKEISKPDLRITKNRPVLEKGNFKLERFRVGWELNAGINILKNNKIFDSAVVEYFNGSRHNVFSFVNDKYFVSGMEYGMLVAYDLNGNRVSRFVGHVGDIWGMSVNPDGKKLITCSADRTIKIWPLDAVGRREMRQTAKSVGDYWREFDLYDDWMKICKVLKISETDVNTKTVEAWQKIIDVFDKNEYPTKAIHEEFDDVTSNYIYPIVSIFITEKGDWLIWDEKGYFTGSRKATRYVGYHVNKGRDKESKYYPFEQFDLKYNRPDIIMQELGIASVEMIDAYKYAYEKRLKKMNITEEQLSADIHLPEVTSATYTYDETTEKLKIKISAKDQKYLLNRLNIFVDDVPVFGSNGIDISKNKKNSFDGEYTVDLIPGKNKIQVSVLNEKGAESLKETFSIIDKKQQKPDLYIVSLGVSNYKDANFNLNFAAKDADDMAHFFEKSEMYNKVLVNELTNEKVTRENILKIKSDFLSKAQPNDVVIFFVAGHGVLNKNLDYYYAAYDMDFLAPEKNGITYEELESLLDGIKPYRKLFFMDSCHSGELDKDDVTAVATTNDTKKEGDIVFRNGGNIGVVSNKKIGLSQSSQLMQEMFSDLRRGSGATVISSAGGAEYAMESKDWKNGLFTFCLLSGMKTKAADLNGDGMIYLSELQTYVQNKVTELSRGKQLPTSRRENLEFDYRVW